MGTYKVASKWQSSTTGYKSGSNTYKRRRKVQVFEHGVDKPVDNYWEYKGLITSEVIAPKEPSKTDPTPLDYAGQESQYKVMPDGTIVETGIDTMTSAEAAIYNKYAQYLDNVTFYNNDLRAKLELEYDLLQAKQGMTNQEKQDHIEKEYELHKIPRYNYGLWLHFSEQGRLPEIELYKPAPIEEEIQLSPAGEYWEKRLSKFAKGAQFGWSLADATGLTRIAAMGVAGMPDLLVGSMATSTAMYGVTQRIAGQQDNLTAAISNLSDNIMSQKGVTTGENYKAMYQVLNDNAKRQGYIKSDWVLRMSRNIPVKERWRRLYVTLVAHIEKQKKRKKRK